MPKPGPKTSEFYVALLSPLIAVYGILAVQFGWTVSSDTLTNALPFVASVAAAVASHGYSNARATVKAAATVSDPATPPDTSGVDAAIAVMES